MANVARYKDFDISFSASALNGDVIKKIDEQAINQSLRNLVQLSRGEKPFNTNIGGGIRQLLFEPLTPMTAIRIQQNLRSLIVQYEPRVILNNLTVTPDFTESGYRITVNYSIRNRPEPIIFDLTLERLR